MKQVCRLGILVLAVAWATFQLLMFVPVSTADTPAAENEPICAGWQVQQIEDYLNNIRTARARFRQESSTGNVAEGYIYIQRPGRIRVEYDLPWPILIVSDGSSLIFNDRQLGQVTYLPLSSTPASVLTRGNIAFRGDDVMITGCEQYEDTIHLTLILATDSEAGSITLVFNPNPVHLKMWSIKDAMGVVTVVSLTQVEFDLQLDQALFRFQKDSDQFP